MEHRNSAAFQLSSGLAWLALDLAHAWSARCFRFAPIVTQSGSPLVQRQRAMMQGSLIFGITLACRKTEEFARRCGIRTGQERDLGRMRGFL